ncbi:hypothetical protein [Rhodopirellula europaea]|uniref:hypothetical protein n=1 Tax=Rhodopirellula europaea TaxID=1263866 RepID=UPI003D2AE229|tara:strand:- start:9357 stop:9782 length:426 start_codon:yes stop_codon:yes gene_type:complete
MNKEAASDRSLPRLGVLWFEVLAGTTAWFVHLILVFGLSWLACVAGWADRRVLSISLVDALVAVTTLICGAVTLLALLWAWHHLKQYGGIGPESQLPDHDQPDDRAARTRFMALFAVYLNAISLLAILAQWVPAFYLTGCD